MKPIGRAVDRALRALGLDRDIARADAVRAWDDARLCQAVRADGDTLVVTVPTAQWAGEVRLRERELVAALAARAPSSGVTRIRPVPSSRAPTPAR